MPVLFARVELRGTPTETVYEKLHAHMKSLNWYQYLPSNTDKLMPHAMYQATFSEEQDLPTIAKGLKSQIEKYVWTKALVLVIRNSGWAQSAG